MTHKNESNNPLPLPEVLPNHVINIARLSNISVQFYYFFTTTKADKQNLCSIRHEVINTEKYHVFAPMGRFQLESIYLYFPPSSQLLGQNDPIYKPLPTSVI